MPKLTLTLKQALRKKQSKRTKKILRAFLRHEGDKLDCTILLAMFGSITVWVKN